MACFIVPATEAVIVTAAALIVKHTGTKRAQTGVNNGISNASHEKQGFARRLVWLAGMLWGGVALLAFEHLWHGEITPFFPFLTAATEGAAAVSEMLREMATVGVGMAILVTVVWAVMVAVSYAIEKRPAPHNAAEKI